MPRPRCRPARVLLAIALVACANRAGDARQAGELPYEGRTLAEWWAVRRDPNDAVAAQAQVAFRMLGPAAVPFLAEKAASSELGSSLGGSVALEGMCANALPALEAARSRYPSPAIDDAIRRVRADSGAASRRAVCAPDGTPVPPAPQR